jgi:hypothetical protein
MPIKSTVYPNSYWNGTGAYQKEYKELYFKLVPKQGSAATLNGELIRAISRLTYEFYNNGNANALIGSSTIHPFYEKFLDLILDTVPGTFKFVSGVRTAILNQVSTDDKDAISAYNNLADRVIHYVLTHDDESLPPNYKRD